MITLKEIAERCGVSVATVSNILNGKPKVSEETRQKVLAVVEETGYQPNLLAQGMRRKKTNLIGIITEDLEEFSSTPIVENIMSVCEDRNYRTLLINMRLYDKWQDTWYKDMGKLRSTLYPALHQMEAIKVDAIIYVAGHCRDIDYFPEDFDIPVLVAYALSNDGKYTSVMLDDEEGGYNVTKYLIDRGHKKIGVITGVADNYHAQHRLIGYQKALFEAQLLYSPKIVKNGDWERESGRRAMEELLQEDITAVFCMNDIMAAGAYDAIYAHGLEVNKDISVIGYDNRQLSEYLRPTLTTNDIRLKTVGELAAKLILEQLEKEEQGEIVEKKVYVVESKLIERDSIGEV